MHRPRVHGSLVPLLFLTGVAFGCSATPDPGGGSPPGRGGIPAEPGATGGRPSGSGGQGGRVEAGTGGAAGSPGPGPGTPDADNVSPPDGATTPTAEVGPGPPTDASSGGPSDGHPFAHDATPMTIDGAPAPSYEGEIPIHYGPEVGPIVQMQCPEDPTAGWTEYKDSFHLEHPYRVAANTRFSITGGIYNFTVFPNDSPHSPIAMGRNPRTEATYGGIRDKANVGTRPGVYAKVAYFTSGMRLYSADMLIEPSAYGSAIMQIHTTSPGGGPIGLRLTGGGNLTNNGNTIVNGSAVPGGMLNKWFNFKASFDTASLEVKIYINNCLKATYKGARGDGRFYFKNGVYFCDAGGGCRTHFKNVHFYEK